jgi:hypothetical protein
MTRAAAEDGIGRWSSPSTQLSNHLRNRPLVEIAADLADWADAAFEAKP